MASKTYRICALPGDGIGPEIIAEAKKVLAALGEKYDVEFVCEDHLIGGAAIDATTEAGGPVSALPAETLEAARASDAVLLAAVGGPKWTDTKVGAVRPEQGLLAIRKELGLYLNLRPVRMFDALIDASSLKPEVLHGVDLIIVRELTGGLYFGGHERMMGVEGAGVGGTRGEYARDVLEYSEYEVDRVVRWAFDAARRRRGVVHSVDKANVLDTSRMWREVAHNIAAEYPDVTLEDMYVDNAAMQLIANPAQFDVLVTENTFGDILSDEASMLTGSLGMLASASLGDGTALYEPSHGSPARASPTRLRRSSRWSSCSATALAWTTPPTSWPPRSRACSTRAGAPWTSPTRARRPRRSSAPPRWATRSWRPWARRFVRAGGPRPRAQTASPRKERAAAELRAGMGASRRSGYPAGLAVAAPLFSSY